MYIRLLYDIYETFLKRSCVHFDKNGPPPPQKKKKGKIIIIELNDICVNNSFLNCIESLALVLTVRVIKVLDSSQSSKV